MASGVFGLRKVYKKQVENVTNNNFASWPESGIYGYFAGGFDATATPTSLSKIDRIDFSNETISVPGTNLSLARYVLGSLSNSSYGYYAGGQAPPPYVATIDRIDFTNETTSTPGNNLSQTKGYLEGISNNSYGYFGGGLGTPGPTVFATVERIDFSNETISSPGNNLPQARYALGATSNDSYGYFGGGATPAYVATVDRIDFANETTSAPSKNLPQSRGYMGATSSANYGYYGGGIRTPGPTTVATVDRIDFSTEIGSAPGNNLPQARYGLTATSNNNYGYYGGGFTSPPPARHSTIDRVDFSNETTSAPGNNLSQIRSGSTALSGGASVTRANGYGTYGYHIGGWGPPAICNITRQDFSSNTFSDVGTISLSLYGNDRSAYNDFYGYFGGGYASSPPPAIRRSSIYRLDFLNESLKTLTNTLPQIADKIAHTSTREVGYFGGGYTFPPIPSTWHSKICKLDFSSESVSTLPASGRLSAQKGGSSAARTPQYAFFGGGYNQVGPAFYSKIDRLDFSTEVASAYTNMTRVRVFHTSIESNTHGYYWGGSGIVSVNDADKLQFSNGTVTNLPGIVGSNPYYYYQNSQTDSYYGYFLGGGWQPYPFAGSFGETLVRRLDFSSDTVALLPPNIPRKAGTSASMSNKYD
jgi:hypothetical protein